MMMLRIIIIIATILRVPTLASFVLYSHYCESSLHSVTCRWDTKVQEGEVSCPMSHILEAEGPKCKSRAVNFEVG